MRYLPLIVVCALCLASSAAAQNWPSFRGPHTSGVAPASASPPVTFDVPASRNVAWRTPIPGLAHSSPVVWDDRVYLTTAVAAKGESTVTTGRAGIDSATDMESHTWRLLAVDANTGAVLWNRAVHTGVPRLKRHVKASHASATPATNGEVVVALLGSEGLFCFDTNGELKWRQQRISESAGGFSASPIAAAGRVYFTSEDGDIFVVRAGRTFELLATNPLGEVAMATPAIAGDLLVVRTRHHLIGLRDGPRGPRGPAQAGR